MKYNRIIIFSLLLTLLSFVGIANATTYTSDFSSSTGWTLAGVWSVSGGTLNAVNSGGSNAFYTAKTLSTNEFEESIKYKCNSATGDSFLYFGVMRTIAPTYWEGFYINVNNGGIGFNNAGSTYGTSGWPVTYNKGQWYTLRVHKYTNNTMVLYVDNIEVARRVVNAVDINNHQWGMHLTAGTNNVQLDDFYADDNGNEQVFTSDTTFKGYIKDANGNPLEYCNVTAWTGNAYGTYLNGDITDANGYYEFGPSTVNIGSLYNISVKPPNSYYTNLYGFTANATTPLTLNFTVNPARLQIYAYDASKGIATGDLSAVNFTLYVSGGGLPGTVTYVRIAHDSPYIFDENIPTGANVSILANKTGFVDKWNNFTSISGWNTPAIAMTGDYSSAGVVYIVGHARDNTGVKLQGIPLYLVRSDTGACIASTTSSNNLLVDPGYYALPVPISPVDYGYQIIGTFPGYGNITCDLRQGGSQADIGSNDIITYDDTWIAEGVPVNTELGVDPWFSQAGTYNPSPTATPTPGGNTPTVPIGYSMIFGQTYNIATGSNVPNIGLILSYQNGTQLSTGTTDASGGYSFTIPDGTGAQIFKVHASGSAQYGSVDTYVSYPFAQNSKTFRNDIGLTATTGFDYYEWYGYLYDAAQNTRLTYGNVTVYGPGDVQVGVYTADQGGNYHAYMDTTLAPGTYILSGQATGYTTQNHTFYIPASFVQFKSRELNVAMVPTNFNNDYNNGIYLEVNDADTGIRLRHALYELSYDNGTYFSSGSLNGQYNVFIGDIPPGSYFLKASYNGYTPATTYVTIAEDQLVDVNISLYAVVAPTALPTSTPSPTPTPSGSTGYNFVDSLIGLWKLLGLDDGSARIMCGFMFIVLGLAAGALTVVKIAGLDKIGNIIIGIGGGAGFAVACLLKDSTGVTLWPTWLLLVGAFAVVILFVYTFTQGRAGGSG